MTLHYRARAEQALGRQLAPTELVHHHSQTQLVICDAAYHRWLHETMKRRGMPTPRVSGRLTYSVTAPYRVGDHLPSAMGPGELMRALNLGASTFYRYQQAGKFKRFEFRRPVSQEKRYSGKLVKRYLDQEGDAL